jgi:hypothetical protein
MRLLQRHKRRIGGVTGLREVTSALYVVTMAKDDGSCSRDLGFKPRCLYVKFIVEEVALEGTDGRGNALDQWFSTRVLRAFVNWVARLWKDEWPYKIKYVNQTRNSGKKYSLIFRTEHDASNNYIGACIFLPTERFHRAVA